MEVKSAVKYEADLDRDFVRWLTSTPLGEKVRQCIQCGACSGSCPMSIYMDYWSLKTRCCGGSSKIIKRYDLGFSVPVVFFTQLLGLALGMSEKELGFARVMVPVEPLLSNIAAASEGVGV